MMNSAPVPLPDPNPIPVLVVEDIASVQHVYMAQLQKMGLVPHSAENTRQAMALFAQHPYPLVLLDLMLPDGDGMDLIAQMRAEAPHTQIIVITAERMAERAVTAMRAGVFDYLTKPVSEPRLQSAINRALAQIRGQRASGSPSPGAVGAFIGQSEQMAALYDRIRQTATSDASVLIVGESGTGKEICAEAIHRLSPRAGNPFVVFDCSAIRADRFESELFGHMRGALPGAISDHAGAAIRADGGTLFLDKLTELDPALQGKLLRFLQNQKVRPVGSPTERQVDLRIVSASDIPPQDAVEQGKLRADLLYRLCVVALHIPPLRERREDIGPLAEHFLRKFAAQEQRGFTTIPEQTLHRLQTALWPGNVRELMNMIRSAVILNDGDALTLDMLPQISEPPPQNDTPLDALAAFDGESLAQIERRIIEYRLARNDQSVPQTARGLQVAPSTLYRKLETWRATEE
ncbi:sigma-54 dependent transcriptional regulator [Thioclava sp. 'Guangxiensis']|uniref:sigma-54-dependent transcriptional regulator n=1 Tax=Thioclava sp. 'Guangxiensis' TaxID=3149044 RepID=UPI003878014C